MCMDSKGTISDFHLVPWVYWPFKCKVSVSPWCFSPRCIFGDIRPSSFASRSVNLLFCTRALNKTVEVRVRARYFALIPILLLWAFSAQATTVTKIGSATFSSSKCVVTATAGVAQGQGVILAIVEAGTTQGVTAVT